MRTYAQTSTAMKMEQAGHMHARVVDPFCCIQHYGFSNDQSSGFHELKHMARNKGPLLNLCTCTCMASTSSLDLWGSKSSSWRRCSRSLCCSSSRGITPCTRLVNSRT